MVGAGLSPPSGFAVLPPLHVAKLAAGPVRTGRRFDLRSNFVSDSQKGGGGEGRTKDGARLGEGRCVLGTRAWRTDGDWEVQQDGY